MRFKELKVGLLELKEDIENYQTPEIEIENPSNVQINEIWKRKAVSDEQLLNMINEKINDLNLMEYFISDIEKLKRNLGAYTATELNDFYEPLNSIINKIDLTIHVQSLSQNNPEEFNYIYAVKLPEYKYFEDVADFTKQLNFIFSTVMYNNRKVKLVGFDKGSEWYQVALDSLVDFKLMALFISEVTKYVKIRLEDKKRENEIDLDAETKKLILDNMATNQMAIKDYTVRRILNENGNIDDREEYEKHQRAFENMAELMIKGTRVEIDKQITTNNSEQNESTLQLPNLESVQGLLDMHSDILIEHSEDDE